MASAPDAGDENRVNPGQYLWGFFKKNWLSAVIISALTAIILYKWVIPSVNVGTGLKSEIKIITGTSLEILFLVLAAVFGFFRAYGDKLTPHGIQNHCGIEEEHIDEKQYPNTRSKERKFVINGAIFIVMYIGFYWYVISSFTFSNITHAGLTFPVNFVLILITGINIAVMMWLVWKYAFYIHCLRALAMLVENQGPVEHIRKVRKAVFRRSQLFEPAGNVFVTVGITATFLGLAFGLATLDIKNILPPIDTPAAVTAPAVSGETAPTSNTTDTVESPPDPAKVQAEQRNSTLRTIGWFVASVGLGLGVSMLGVLLTLMAQALRGHGPAMETDELLERADKLVRAGGGSTADDDSPQPAVTGANGTAGNGAAADGAAADGATA